MARLRQQLEAGIDRFVEPNRTRQRYQIATLMYVASPRELTAAYGACGPEIEFLGFNVSANCAFSTRQDLTGQSLDPSLAALNTLQPICNALLIVKSSAERNIMRLRSYLET